MRYLALSVLCIAFSTVEAASSKLSSITIHDLLTNNTGAYNQLFGHDLAAKVDDDGEMSGLIGGIVANIVNGLASTLVEPSKFLGMGIGTGAVMGLNLSVMNASAKTPASGVDGVAMNLGMGLSSSVVKLVDINAIAGVKNGDLTSVIVPLSLALAQGLGSGAVSALKINTAAAAAPPLGASGGASAIAGNFGTGLSTSFITAAGIQPSTLTSSLTSGSTLLQQIGPVALGFGKGVGTGSAKGFGLQTNDSPPSVSSNPGFDISLIAQNFAHGLTSSFLANGTVNALAKVANVPGDASGAVQLLATQLGPIVLGFGAGLGKGATVGFGLKVSGNNEFPTGQLDIKGVVQTFSTALSSSFLENGTASALAKTAGVSLDGNAAQNIMTKLGPVFLGLGKGLGSGTATGLGFHQAPPDPLQDGISAESLSQTFAASMASSFISNGTLNALAKAANVDSTAITSSLMQQVGSVVIGFGQGLGGGAALGLGLQNGSESVKPPNTTEPAALSKSFAEALSSSFLANGTLGSITKTINISVNTSSLQGQIAPAAVGFGRGLSIGTAIGLGLQTDDGIPVDPNANLAQISMAFAKGLSSNFLGNGSLSRLTTLVPPTSNFNGFAIISGFARGFLSGAGTSIVQVGGLKAILDGSAVVPESNTAVTPLPPNALEDSLNGFSTGFGAGLGSEGVILGLKLSGSKVATTATTSDASANDSSIIPLISNLGSGNFSPATVDPVLQFGAEALTCEGFGGIAKVFVGLVQSGTIPFSLSNTSSLDAFANTFPDESFTVTNDGNTYEININRKSLTVNGMSLLKIVILLTLHIMSALWLYFFIFPSIWALDALRSLVVLIGRPDLVPNIPKWMRRARIFLVLPTSIFTIVMAVLGSGTSPFFSTPHGLIGIFMLVFTLSAVAIDLKVGAKETVSGQLKVAQTAHIILVSVMASVTALTGFVALSSVSFCIISVIPPVLYVALGAFTLGPITVGMSVTSLQWYIKRWVMKRRGTSSVSMNPSSASSQIMQEKDVSMDRLN